MHRLQKCIACKGASLADSLQDAILKVWCEARWVLWFGFEKERRAQCCVPDMQRELLQYSTVVQCTLQCLPSAV